MVGKKQGQASKGKNTRIKEARADRFFDAFLNIIMLLFLFVMLYPLYFALIASFSSIEALGLGKVFIYPVGFNLEAYRNVFLNKDIWVGYRNSIFYAMGSTLYNLALMLPLAYALSKKYMFGRTVVSWFFIFTMYFGGGIVPTFMLISRLGMINTYWVMILGGVSVYNTIVCRTFFTNSIPIELYESAKIDGASEYRCFFQIALPLSSAIIAVMSLYSIVGSWNSYFGAMIYITKKSLFPLQLVLRNILVLGQRMLMDTENFSQLSHDEQLMVVNQARMAEAMKYAVIYIASAPLLIAYPFIQKYFVKGVMVGSLKG